MQKNQIRRIFIFIGFSFLVFGSGFTAVSASDAPAEESGPDWFFHDIVDVQFVMQHTQGPLPENVMIIDARPAKPKFVNGHIPFAVNIPDTQFDRNIRKLPVDKNALLIYYCGGLKCRLSHKSAKKAEALGYTNVKVFSKGFPGWMKAEGNYASVSAEWVKKQLDSGTGMVLVDSRPKRKKFDRGHIPGAVSIPDMEFDKRKDALPADKDSLLVFYCGGSKCKLSHKSAKKAIALGYTDVKVFTGGYPEWKAFAGAAEKTETTAAAPKAGTRRFKAGKEEGSIDIEFFKKLVSESPDTAHIYDVRDADEFKKGNISVSVNIPVDDLEKKVKTLPSDKPLIFICGTGARSGESFYMLQDLRPELKEVYYVDAEMTFKKDGSYTIRKPNPKKKKTQ